MMEDKLRFLLQDTTERLPGLGAVDDQIIRRARRRVATRAAAVAVAAIVIVAAASFGTTQLIGQENFGPAQPTRDATWEPIPPAPIEGRAGHVAVSTGTEMLVWGGHKSSDDPAGLIDGAAFDYASGEWRTMSQAPLQVSGGRTAVWTGREMLVWGGEFGDGSHTRPDNGAAYDPSSDSWRELSASPSWSLASHSAIWTGTELIVWGGVGMEGRGAAFDPVAGSWRSLPSAPVEPRSGHAAVWTGTEMIVWGGADGSGNPLANGAAYDPETESWRVLSPAPLAERRSPAAVWTGTEIIVWGGWNEQTGTLFDGATYEPTSDMWREIPRSPVSADLPGTSVIWTGNEMVVAGATGKLGMYAPSENAWRALPDPPSGRVVQPSLISHGGDVILWGGVNHDENSFSDQGGLLSFTDADGEDRAVVEDEIDDGSDQSVPVSAGMCGAESVVGTVAGSGEASQEPSNKREPAWISLTDLSYWVGPPSIKVSVYSVEQIPRRTPKGIDEIRWTVKGGQSNSAFVLEAVLRGSEWSYSFKRGSAVGQVAVGEIKGSKLTISAAFEGDSPTSSWVARVEAKGSKGVFSDQIEC